MLDGMAAWSPDGKRIAVYEMGNAESPQVIWTAEGRYRTLDHETDERVLLTVARDGSDLQTLIEEQGVLFLPRKTPVEASVDLAVCKEGVVVSEPVANPGLVADCEALLQSRDMLSNTLNLKWNAETPLDGVGRGHAWRGTVAGARTGIGTDERRAAAGIGATERVAAAWRFGAWAAKRVDTLASD